MKNSTMTLAKTLLGATALTLAAAGAQAQVAGSGLYIGGALGQSHYKGDNLNGLSTNRSDTAGKLYGGYQFHPNFAVEAGVADLGKVNSALSESKTQAVYLDGVATMPLGNDFSALARVGIANGRVKNTLAGKDSGTALKVGAGVQYALSPNTSLRGEWERYRFDTFGTKSNTDVYSIGVNYAF